jgi:hypothetical protein
VLTETERQFVSGEHETVADNITGKDLLELFKEPTNYLGAWMYFGKLRTLDSHEVGFV